MNHIAIIFDPEIGYAKKLASYCNASTIFPFEVRYFNEEYEANRFLEEEEPEIVIVDEANMKLLTSWRYKEAVVLSGSESKRAEELLYVYKYQSGEKIIKEIMGYLAKSDSIGAIIKRKTRMKIFSFYSPVKRTYSTTIAVGMGQYLSRRNKTLYINLESFSGLESVMNTKFSHDLTDMLYYMESKGSNMGTFLAGFIERSEGLDILPPVRNHNDLISITIDKWREMILRIEQDTDYEYLIFDLSEGVQGLFEILQMSDYVFSCMNNDEVALYKMKQYEDALSISCSSVIDKLRKYNTTELDSGREGKSINQMLLGDYIKSIVQGVVQSA